LAEACARRSKLRLPSDAAVFRPPVAGDKILGVAMDYHAFVLAAREAGMTIPSHRIWFYRPRGCLAGAHDDVWLPEGALDFDYEAEMAVTIGRRCRYVTAAEAPHMIAGY
jgi:2-keto-4-pentenoate hydratase/2-oxohepta-3-ene-1,7-dioic acid hydratase in catechol pathway